MHTGDIKMRNMLEHEFRREMRALEKKVKVQIERYLAENYDQIVRLQFGHEPGIRIYKIILQNGEEKVWKTRRLEQNSRFPF